MLSKGKKFLVNADPRLGEIIQALPSPQALSTKPVFHDLMSCILEQQIHYRSTKRVFQKMLDASNLTVLRPDNFAQFEEHAFKDIKLSLKKYETVLSILDHWKQASLNWTELSDESVRKELAEIKGIGPWTIDMILIYTLDRPNVFAYDDYHIKQVMTSLYDLNPTSKLKAQMREVAEAWSPYKSLAFRYLLEWKTFNKKNKGK